MEYSFVGPGGHWTTLSNQNMTISSPAGTGGQIPVVAVDVTDSSASESDPWDVRFLFNGTYAFWTLSDGNFLFRLAAALALGRTS